MPLRQKLTSDQIKERLRKYGAKYDIDENYLNSFQSALKDYSTGLADRYDSVQYNGYADSIGAEQSKIKDLQRQSRYIRAWINSGGSAYENPNEMLKALDETDTMLGEDYKAFDSKYKYFSQFETEDDYNIAQNLGALSAADVQKLMGEMKDWYNFEKDQKRVLILGHKKEHMEHNGYDSNFSKYGLSYDNYDSDYEMLEKLYDSKKANEDFTRIMSETPEDILKSKIDRNATINALRATKDGYLEPNKIYEQFTDEELAALLNYKNTTGKGVMELAWNLYDPNEYDMGILRGINDIPVLEQAANAIHNFGQFPVSVWNLASSLLGQDPLPKTEIDKNFNAIRSDDKGVNKVFNELASGAGYMLPSILTGKWAAANFVGPVGQNLGLVSMGASAAGNAYAEFIDLGYDKIQARNYGILVGTSEALLEKLLGGIDFGGGKGGIASATLKKFGPALRKYLPVLDNVIGRVALDLGANMIDEGVEEAIQTALEPVLKIIATGDMNTEPAKLEEILYSALIGALMGGMFEFVPTISDNIKTNRDAKAFYGENAKDLVSEAIEIDSGNSYAQRMQKRLDKGKNLSGYQLSRIVEENERTLNAQDSAKIKSAVAERLTSLGETGDVDAIASALAKQAAGEDLSFHDRKVLKESKFGQRVANEISPENIKSGGYTSAWAENIGTERINAEEYNRGTGEVASVENNTQKPAQDLTQEAEPANAGKYLAKSVESVTDGKTVTDGQNAAQDENTGVSEPTVESLSKKYGAQAKAYVRGYNLNAGQDIDRFDSAFALAYNMGKSGVSFDYVKKSAAIGNDLTDAQKELAYNAGKESADVEARNNYLRNVLQSKKKGGTINENDIDGGINNAEQQAEQKAENEGKSESRIAGSNERALSEDGNGRGVSEENRKDRQNAREDVHFQSRQRELSQKEKRFSEESFIVPKDGTIEAEEYNKLSEYGIEGYVVKKTAWDRTALAFARDGRIYIREEVSEEYRGTVVAHEATHIMKQLHYQPYLDFLDRTPMALNMASDEARQLIEIPAKHYNIDIFDNNAQLNKIFDEINATVYGSYIGGQIVGDIKEYLYNAFNDFDAYINELSEIHEQFKKENTSARSEAKKAVRRRGFVKSEGVKLSELKKAFNDTQNKAYKILDTIARVTGINIVVYESDVDADGNFIGKQGKFKWSNDTIYIDINAGLENNYDVGDLAKYTMLRTFSHEFSHFIEKWNPIQYNELRRAIFNELTARGADVDELITNKLAEDSTGKMTYEEASREVVAESLTDILPDSSFIETLANKHKNVFNKLLSKLKEFIADIKAYFKSIGSEQIEEANKLKEEIDGALHYAENIVKLFDEVAVDAVENYQAANPKADSDGKVQYQERYGSTKKANETKITAEMSEEERYEALKKRSINNIPLATELSGSVLEKVDQISSWDDINNFLGKEKRSIIEKIATEFDVFNKEYLNEDIDLSFEFSGNNFRESYNKQKKNYLQFAKMFSVFDSVIGNAIGVEIHNRTDYKPDPTLDNVFVLMSAYQDGDFIIPVKLEVKQFKDKQNTLYVAISLEKIKMVEVLGQGNTETGVTQNSRSTIETEVSKQGNTETGVTQNSRSVNISISKIFEKINPSDKSFLKYIPDGFLNDTQKQAKKEAIIEDIDNAYANAVKRKDDITAQKLLDKKVNFENSNEQYRERTRTLTVGDFIEMADSGELDIELTAAEKDFIRIYKKKVNEFNSLKDQSEKLGKIYSEQQFGKDGKKPNRDEAIKTLNRKKIIDGKVEKESLEIMKMQDSAKVLPTLLEKTKKAATAKERAKNAEKRKEYFERKHNTEIRNKTIKLAKELYTLLYKGTKKKNIKEGMVPFVRKALELRDVFFVSDDELIVNGITVTMTPSERAAIEKYQQLYEELHSTDDNVTEHKEERAELRRRMYELKKKESIDKILLRERTKISEEKAKDTFEKLASEYKALKNADEDYLRDAYDENVYKRIIKLSENIGDTLVSEMSLAQLKDVYEVYKIITHAVRTSNKRFDSANNESFISRVGAVDKEFKTQKQQSKYILGIREFMQKQNFNNQLPIYAILKLHSPELQRYFKDIQRGEDVCATDIAEAFDFARKTEEKYGAASWNQKSRKMFKSLDGKRFELDLGQRMAIYAYLKRNKQLEHFEVGGFRFDKLTKRKKEKGNGKETLIEYKYKDTTDYRISKQMMFEISETLTDEQRAFADEMQNYLSTVMGEKGNEVSLKLYGIRLYEESDYFTLKSVDKHKEDFETQANGHRRLENIGFSERLTPGANNAVVLSSFMDVWAEHVYETSMYHAFTVPLKDFSRVLGFKSRETGIDIRKSIEDVYGDAAVQYLDRLVNDLNGDIMKDHRTNWLTKLTALHKKAAVMMSLSVAAQQPTSIVRAMALVDPKHFKLKKLSRKKHKAAWEEIKKYAPVAIIKEIGSFDTGTSRGAVEWIKGEKTAFTWLDNKFSWLPAYLDEKTWIAIWNAVEYEALEKNPKLVAKSEEFFKIVGERFTEVIRMTQVYDSTLSRSANMRSKDTGMAMATSFMAENTVTLNMLEYGIASAKQGDKKTCCRMFAGAYGSILLNAVVVAFIYAARDDDDDETYAEKYLSSLTSKLIDGVNPLTMMPFIRDIWSVFNGYDIERADMSLITDLAQSLERVISEFHKEDGNVPEAIFKVIDSVSSFFGIPVKNIRRDIYAICNFIATAWSDISSGDLGGEKILEGMGESARKSFFPVDWFLDIFFPDIKK